LPHLGMNPVVVSSRTVIYEFSPDNPPCCRVNPGDTVVFETMDAFGGQILSEQDLFEKVGWHRVNPATGPVVVEGAQSGDTLCVEIHSIRTSFKGVMVAVPGLGAVPDKMSKSRTFVIPIRNGLAHLPGDILLETRPMIGVIGTAPQKGSIPCGTPGPHGGNMDTKIIAEGATVYLPVFVQGGLLAMGDLHALMGDGEVLVSGVEVAGKVTVKVNLIKKRTLPCPLVETKDAFYAIWSEKTLDEAVYQVVWRSADLLSQHLGLDFDECVLLLSARGNLQISQVVDPLKTVRMEIPKVLLKGKSLVSI
jgi:amidase